MKRNTNTNTSNITAIVLIAVFIVGGFYLLSRGDSGSQIGNVSPAGNAISSGSLNNLVGKPVPVFSIRDRNGTEYSSESLKGKNVVLFFNEGIMCYPACWNQMVALATDPRFGDLGITAFSVVIDQPSDWQSAIRKMPDLGKAAVLFDSDKSVSRAFGMLTVPSSMHYGSYPGHSFVMIDKQGIIRSIFDDPNMAIDNDRVLAEMKAFK